MRDIKFRLWVDDEKRMYYGKTACAVPEFTDRWGWTEKNKYTLEQYIGINDRNGIEIYEGDIILIGGKEVGSFGKVIFEYGSFMLTNIYECDYSDTYYSCINGEVIGNIHETPELFR